MKKLLLVFISWGALAFSMVAQEVQEICPEVTMNELVNLECNDSIVGAAGYEQCETHADLSFTLNSDSRDNMGIGAIIDIIVLKNVSVGLSINTQRSNKFEHMGNLTSYNSLNITFDTKIYLFEETQGFYFSPYLRATNRSYTANYTTLHPVKPNSIANYNYAHIVWGSSIGYKLVSYKGLVFGATMGIGKNIIKENNVQYDPDFYVNNTHIRSEVYIGWRL